MRTLQILADSRDQLRPTSHNFNNNCFKRNEDTVTLALVMGEVMSKEGKSASAQEETATHVVIVGGGYGGVACALQLRRLGINFTLIESKNFLHHNVAALRAAVDIDLVQASLIPLDKTFGHENFLQGRVVAVDLEQNAVTVSIDNEQEARTKTIEFSHLVMATGSRGPFPGRTEDNTVESATKHYTNMAEQIRSARRIVVIGGGAVGVELVGEIRDLYADKQITLIHSGEELLSGSRDLTSCMRSKTLRMLQSMNIDVHLGKRVTNLSDLVLDTYTDSLQRVLTKNQSFDADLVLLCTGLRPESTLITANFPESAITSDNRLRVNEYLEVREFSHVFAIGDCCDFPQEKMAAHAGDHGQLVANNIALKHDYQLKRKPYVPRFQGMVVTVGRYGGVGSYNGWQLPSFIVRLFKARDLFVAKYWTDMGQRVPT